MLKTIREHQNYRLSASLDFAGLQIPAGIYAGVETWVEDEDAEAEADEHPTPTRHVLRLTPRQYLAASSDSDQPFVNVDVTDLVRVGRIEPMLD